MDRDLCLVHEHLDLHDLCVRACTKQKPLQRVIIPPQDLLAGSRLARLVIADTVSVHIHSHICRRFVGAFSIDLLEHGFKNREDLHIAVIIDGGLSVSFQMEGIDHVDIVEVRGCRLIS